MTPMQTLQSNRRLAAVRNEMTLRNLLGNDWVDAENARRLENYRGLLAEAQRIRAARAVLVAPEPQEDTLF